MAPPEFLYSIDSEKDAEFPGRPQEFLGHKSLVMTERYPHLVPEKLQNDVIEVRESNGTIHIVHVPWKTLINGPKGLRG